MKHQRVGQFTGVKNAGRIVSIRTRIIVQRCLVCASQKFTAIFTCCIGFCIVVVGIKVQTPFKHILARAIVNGCIRIEIESRFVHASGDVFGHFTQGIWAIGFKGVGRTIRAIDSAVSPRAVYLVRPGIEVVPGFARSIGVDVSKCFDDCTVQKQFDGIVAVLRDGGRRIQGVFKRGEAVG